MARKMDSEMHRDILDAVEAAGWPTRKGSKHILVYPPEGRPIAISTTKVGRRSQLNTRSAFRRAGLDV